MSIEKHTIILTADMQYKNRDINLINSYQKTSEAIEQILIDTKADIYVFAGDFVEYPTPNDSERSLMFKHLGNVLNIDTVKEMVVMNGNHDLLSGKKIELSQKENNPLNTFVQSSKAINPELSKKINYLKKQKEYSSLVSNLISWVSYSLEDGLSVGNNLVLSPKNNNKYRIPVFHDILYQYVNDKKLPISKSKLDTLMRIEDFKVNPDQKALVIAGDIHEKYETFYKEENSYGDVTFMYPGEPIQRNHGMGSYYKVTPSGPMATHAPKKSVKRIDLYLDTQDITKTYFELSDIELPNTLEYITFNLNNKKFVDNWKEQLEILLSNLTVSNYTNIIKIEISNIYMKYEMEILDMITTRFDKLKQQISFIYYVNLVYGNVIFDKDSVEIIGENDNDDSDDTNNIEFNDIVLDQSKLKKIFQNIIESQSKNILKEFTNPDEFNEVIAELNSIFDEQIDYSYGSKSSYNVQLIDIKTNGFMALGKNDINLNIPGLTRIVGNNGIGKTTLFNMLRWCIKGMVIEGLPKNTKKENLLLVFNYDLPENDDVSVSLKMVVNNIPVEITRTANRTWKKSATLEDKKSLNWKEFIDTATSKLVLHVHPKDKDVVIKLNDDAQNIIDQWFGNTIENIFILNQFKISQLLNTSGDTLKETVLDYIGIDYIKSLINNLEIIKPNYLVPKPDKAQIDIVIERNQIMEATKRDDELMSSLFFETERTQKSKDEETEKLKLTNSLLLDIGNVPKQIEDNKVTLNSLQQKVDNFNFLESKEIPIFSEVEPIKDEISIKKYSDIIEENKLKHEIVNNEYLVKFQTFNEIKGQKLNIINDTIVKLKTENENILINGKEDFRNNLIKLLPIIKDLKATKLKELSASILTDKENISSNINANNDKLIELKINLQKKLEEIKSVRNIIENAFCSQCKKPLNLTEEEINDNKEKLVTLNQEKDNQLITINEQTTLIKELNDKLVAKDSELKKIESYLNWNSSLTSKEDFLSDLEKINKLIDVSFDKQLIIELNNGLKLWETFESLNTNARIVENKETINRLENVKNTLATLTSESTITDELSKTKFLNELVLIINDLNVLKVSLAEINTKINDNQKLLKTINDEYNINLSSYMYRFKAHNDNVSKIIEHNNTVNDHNKLLVEYSNNINILTDTIKNLEIKLPEYNEYKASILESTENINQLDIHFEKLSEQKNRVKTDKILRDEKLNVLNTLEERWTLYRKKNFIYKTYEKMIKNDFKMAIFNYYRTFLNNKLNILLEGLNFRLYWNNDANLFLSKFSKTEDGNTELIYLPVKLASGMQSTFLGLSLIYAIHTLNIRNSLSHIFIDEISGQLNSGKNSSNEKDTIDESQTKNYQEQLVYLLNKFTEKNIFIVDHVIDNLWETYTYNVNRKLVDNKIVTVYE